MYWDEVVDVVCVGSGSAGLASAIVATDQGEDVFVAVPAEPIPAHHRTPAGRTPEGAADLAGYLGIVTADPDTETYLESMSRCLSMPHRFADDVGIPVRTVSTPEAVRTGRRGRPTGPIPRFSGAELTDWADQCVASPHGMMLSRIAGCATEARYAGPESFQVKTVGSFTPDPELPDLALADWLFSAACEREIAIHAATPLRRLIFDGGQVAGVEVAGPRGPYTVGARRTVAITTAARPRDTGLENLVLSRRTQVQVSLVAKIASRFFRLELLAADELTASRSTWSRQEQITL